MQKDDQGSDTPVSEVERFSREVDLALEQQAKLRANPEAIPELDHLNTPFPDLTEEQKKRRDFLIAHGPSSREERDPLRLPTFEQHMRDVESGEYGRRLDYHRERILAEKGQDIESPDVTGVDPGISPRSTEKVFIDTAPSNKTTAKDVRQALEQAAVSVDSLDSGDKGARARAVLTALAAAKQLEKNQFRKKIKFWLGWVVFFCLLGGIGYGGWVWAKPQLAVGRYTVPVTCKIPYAGDELEVHRNFTYPYKSLLGYHLVDEGAVEIEDEVVLQGDKLTILGIKNGKTWRKDYSKGEFGTAKLPNTDIYWFVGEKTKDTKAVTFNSFCN